MLLLVELGVAAALLVRLGSSGSRRTLASSARRCCDWQAAHLIVQDYEEDRTAAWIHAIVHRMEGDVSNAEYWYRRCRRHLREDVSTADELREVAAMLAEK